MVIPYFWAETRLHHKLGKKQVTVKRWGWSDVSQDDAQDLANRRANEAKERILNGEKLRRLETKDVYGNEDGVPIREEVISKHGEVVITRNSYGSLCLNTPNLLFADVDAEWHGALEMRLPGGIGIIIGGITIGYWQNSILLGVAFVSVVAWLWSFINNQINRRRRPLAEANLKQENLNAVRNFLTKHPEWNLRVYETPAGHRLLAMHDVFDPQGDAAKSALNELNSDKRFVNLCAIQACFRARVSPKYWRMGYKPKNSLPKSKWPFPTEHLAIRKEWVTGYDAISSRFASCRFIEQIGSNKVHPEAEAVRLLHDQLCQSNSNLPLA
jgi:hypothetical protein